MENGLKKISLLLSVSIRKNVLFQDELRRASLALPHEIQSHYRDSNPNKRSGKSESQDQDQIVKVRKYKKGGFLLPKHLEVLMPDPPLLSRGVFLLLQ